MVKTAFFQLKILWKTINYLRPIFQTIWRCSDSWTTLTLLPDQTESGPRSTQITEYWRYWLRTMLGDFRSDCRGESGRMLQLHRAAFSSTLVLEIGCDFLLFRLRSHVEKFSELWDEHRDTFLLECGSWEPADLSVDMPSRILEVASYWASTQHSQIHIFPCSEFQKRRNITLCSAPWHSELLNVRPEPKNSAIQSLDSAIQYTIDMWNVLAVFLLYGDTRLSLFVESLIVFEYATATAPK